MIPNTDWFPWDQVKERDRGYETACWVWCGPVPPTATTINVKKKVKKLFSTYVPERPTGHVWMHLCERYQEMNLCVRPDHIVVGTKSANMAHWHALRSAAGDPPNISQAHAARIGSHHTLEARRKIGETRRARYGKQKH